MMDDRLKAKRQMFDDIEQWARGKSMDKFRPKAVIERDVTIIRPTGNNGAPVAQEPELASDEVPEQMEDKAEQLEAAAEDMEDVGHGSQSDDELEQLVQAMNRRA